MSLLLVVLLACGIRRLLDSSNRLPTDLIWTHWASRLVAVAGPWTGRNGPLLTGVLIAFLTGMVSLALATAGWLVLQRSLDILVLLLALGLTGWKPVLQAYGRAWQRGDMQAAWRHSQRVLRAGEAAEATAPETLHQTLLARLMTSVFERYFLILFWFLVAGPGGAVAARWLVALQRVKAPGPGSEQDLATQVYRVLAWAPVRLLAITYALAGQAEGRFQAVRRQLLNRVPVGALLSRAAAVSLGADMADPTGFSRRHPDQWRDYADMSLAAVRDLQNRSLMIWLAAVALLVILGVF